MASHRGGPATYILFFMAGPFLLGGPLTLAMAASLYAEGNTQGGGTFVALGGAFLALGVIMAVGGVFVRRSMKAKEPEAQGDPVEWSAWAVSQRSGHWKGDVNGRTYVAQRLFRKQGVGHIVLRLSSVAASRATLIRRSGAKATVGRTIDAIAGQDTTSAADLGYPDMEFAATEPDWASAFLGAPDVVAAVRQVMGDCAGAQVVTVSVRPGFVGFTLGFPSQSTVTTQTTGRWLAALETLAATLEALPAPAEALTPNYGERLALDPDKARKHAFIFVFSLIGVMMLFGLAIVGVMMLFRAAG